MCTSCLACNTFKEISIELWQITHYKKSVVEANRGSIYADDGSLLATSVPKYDIRFDAVTVSKKNFSENLKPLCDSLSKMLGNTSNYYKAKLKKQEELRIGIL